MKKSEEIFWMNLLLYAFIGPLELALEKEIVKYAFKDSKKMFEKKE
ncbi:hypothetical protein LCGC14_2192340 [marine sediment metagenome]|uniref:Uncharacterized protein n=1 Tax=marine sediment metagenome TaxID=412755 RepID=A0A0F9DJ65_9ZZZZ